MALESNISRIEIEGIEFNIKTCVDGELAV